MVRKTVPAGRGTLGSLLGAGVLGVLVVATAAACASTPRATGASSTGSVPVVASSSAPAASSSASASPSGAGGASATAPTAAASASEHPFIPSTRGVLVTPKAQLSAAPAGKLTIFDSAARSADGKTLYLGLESQGGACGQYDVVLQQSSSSVAVGLVHLSAGGRICPMYVAHMLVVAKLAAPLAGRTVVDLANGQVVQAPAVS